MSLLLLLGGCHANRPAPPPRAHPPAPAAGSRAQARWAYKTASGAELFKIKLKSPDKFKLERGDGSQMATLKVESDRVKVKDAAGHDLFKIKRKSNGAEVEDGSGNRLYRIKNRAGGFKVEDARGHEVFKIKARSGGYEIRRPNGSVVVKVKARDGKVEFKSESGQRLYELKGVTDPRAALWMAAEPINAAARAGLVVFYLEVH